MIFIIVTLLTFLSIFAPKIASFVTYFIPNDTSVQNITSNIVNLKKELCLISIVDEFAKHARLQRRIIKLQDERKKLLLEKDANIDKVKDVFLFVIYGITSVALFSLVYIYKEEPVAHLPAEWLWPTPHVFGWFNGDPGCISIPSWIIMTFRASKIIFQSL